MNEKELQQPERKDLIEELRNELQQMCDEEIAKKERGEEYDLHFEDINSEELREEDLILFYKFRNKTLTKEELKQFSEKLRKFDKEKFKTSRAFEAWLRNQLSHPKNSKWFDKELFNSLPESIKKKYS